MKYVFACKKKKKLSEETDAVLKKSEELRKEEERHLKVMAELNKEMEEEIAKRESSAQRWMNLSNEHTNLVSRLERFKSRMMTSIFQKKISNGFARFEKK